MHYLYVLQCRGGHLYLGVTKDPRERIAAHERGTACRFTKEHPVERMVYIEPFHDEQEADRIERQLVYDLEALRHPLRVAGGPLTGFEDRAGPDQATIDAAKQRHAALADQARAEVYKLARKPVPLVLN